jgi:hypothetical protein
MTIRPAIFIFTSMLCLAAASISSDGLKMLQDPGGWEYITLSDPDNGVQTTHTCFDGKPHPDQCSGSLILSSSNTFAQRVTVHGQNVDRHGTYQLDADQISFFDEFGTRDGPYTVDLDQQKKTLVLSMPQIRIQLQLEKEYRKAAGAPK